jgi:hypothetical protein
MLEGLAPTDYRTGPCGLVKRAHSELSPTDRDILLAALENRMFSNLNLAEQLTERGFSTGEAVIRKHRNGKCACARKPK